MIIDRPLVSIHFLKKVTYLLLGLVLAACSGRYPVNDRGEGVLNLLDGALVEDGGETSKLIITVKLSRQSSKGVIVDYTTQPGSARPGLDYEEQTGKLVIPAGQLSGQVAITILPDTEPEPDEHFYLTVTEVKGAQIGKAQAVATVMDNDTDNTKNTCGNCDTLVIGSTPLPLKPLVADISSIDARGDECDKTGVLRIMPLGDSITLGGYNNEGGYRRYLSGMLNSAGYRYDFVGSQKHGLGFDMDHEGWSGLSIDAVRKHVRRRLRENPADVILLHIGSNGERDVEKIGRLLDEIYAASPNSKVLLAQIINFNVPDAQIVHFNQELANFYHQRGNNGNRLFLVNMEAALSVKDMFDKQHPDSHGYNKMARVWFDALTKVSEACRL